MQPQRYFFVLPLSSFNLHAALLCGAAAVRMKQLALDIGLPTGPSLERFYAGRNAPVAQHVRAWVFERQGGHMPVPTYVWGAGKAH